MKRFISGLIGVAIIFAASAQVFAHCQIPCGIFDDQMRFEMMREDVDTIAKSMREIKKLSGKQTKNYNQIVRWVNNKDDHAEKIEDAASYYFLAQRVKPVAKNSKDYERYTQQVILLHKIIIQSMKAKQTTSQKHVKNLRGLIQKFEHSYFNK